jgi:hypothetical protein
VGDTVVVGETDPDRLRLGLPVLVGLTERVRLGDDVADHEYDARADAERETVWETLAVGERDRDEVTVTVADDVPERLLLGLTVPVGLRVSVGVVERVRVEETVVEGDRVKEGDPLEDTVEVGVRVLGVRVEDIDPVASADAVRLTVGLALTERERVGDPVAEGDPDTDRLRVGEVEVLGLAETVDVLDAAERVAVIVRVADTEGDADTVAEPDVLGDPDVLCDALVLPVVEGDPEALCVPLTDTDAVGVPVGLTVVDTVAVAEGVAGTQAPAGRAFSTGPAAA